MSKSRESRLRDINKKRRRRRRAKMVFFGSLVLAVLLIALIYISEIRERTYRTYEVLSSSEHTDDMATGFLPYGNGMIRYNRNGALAYDRDAKPIWKGSYEMQNPIGDVCKEYAVVADRGNKLIEIFNKKGSVGNIRTNKNILKVEVAQQGVVAVLSEDHDSNYINLYSKDGKELVDAKITSVSEEGYPIDIALSENGKKLVVSHIAVNQGQLVSYLAFYNFGEVGQNEPGRLVAGVFYKNAVIPRVAFLNNDYVCVYKEDSVMLFHMEEIPELIIEHEVEEEIKSILYDERHYGLVLESKDALHKNLLLYNLKGKKVLEEKIDFNYDKIFLYGEEIIIHDNLSAKIFKLNGIEKFSYTFSNNISAIYPINNIERYLLVGEDRISSIKLIN